MAYKKRFAFIKRNPGQLVTYNELQNIGKYPRSTLLDLLADSFRGYTGIKRSGVVSGFACAPSTSPRTINIGAGLGFSYNPVLDVLGESFFPVVLESPVTVTLDLAVDANPRFDLICLRPLSTDSDLATRSVRLPSGALTTSNLYGETLSEADYTVDIVTGPIYTGTPAAAPAVPTGNPGDIPIAVVRVPGGAAGVIAAGNVFDVRGYLNPRSGGTSEYLCYATTDNAGAVTAATETVSDPTIQIDTPCHYGLNRYGPYLAIPKVFGTHPTEYFDMGKPIITAIVDDQPVAPAVTPTAWTDARRNLAIGAGTTTHPIAIYNVYFPGILHINDRGVASTFTTDFIAGGDICLSVKYMRTD